MASDRCCKLDCIHSLFNVDLIELERQKFAESVVQKLDQVSVVRMDTSGDHYCDKRNQAVLEHLNKTKVELCDGTILQPIFLGGMKICRKAFGMIIQISKASLYRLLSLSKEGTYYSDCCKIGIDCFYKQSIFVHLGVVFGPRCWAWITIVLKGATVGLLKGAIPTPDGGRGVREGIDKNILADLKMDKIS